MVLNIIANPTAAFQVLFAVVYKALQASAGFGARARRDTLHSGSGGGGGDRNRTDDKGFADLCLTTWLRRRRCPVMPARGWWSGKRDSNPRLRPWQGRTLPLSYSRSRGVVIPDVHSAVKHPGDAAFRPMDSCQPTGLKASTM